MNIGIPCSGGKITIINALIMKKYYSSFIILGLAIFVFLTSCDNVEDGYRINYPESDADFTVELLTNNRGAQGDTINFLIKVKSNSDIKSLVVNSTESGGFGTGFFVENLEFDPLIDHVYGTIQENVQQLNLNYLYLIPNDSADVTVNFNLIDGNGKLTISHKVFAVPNVVHYNNVEMYSFSSLYTDGFASTDGTVYHNLPDYETLNAANIIIQESIDFAPIVNDKNELLLVAPYNGWLNSRFSAKNKTLLKLLDGIDSDKFETYSTPAELSKITEEYEVKKGSTVLYNIKVGDVIGFRTDFSATNPYHFGLIRINAIHPTNSPYYEGVSYLIEMDIAVQN